MGTITRTFANNITTSGVFKPTAFNNASFDNVTAVPEGALPAGGSMVLLSTQTASGDASISFTSGITSTYKEYMFIFNNIHPASDHTDGRLTFNLSTDGGSTYNVTKTSTFFEASHNESGSAIGFAYEDGFDLAQNTGYQSLSRSISNDNDHNLAGFLHLFDPSNTTFVKHFISTINTNFAGDPDYSAETFMAGYANTTSAINAIDFKCTSGNIDAGTIQMFGIL
jgi:hypothetical protein